MADIRAIIKSKLEKILGQEWYRILELEIDRYVIDILIRIAKERATTVIFPQDIDIFNAYSYTKPQNVKVVIIAQDPYHTPGIAHGLAFSSATKFVPPSLDIIFREIYEDLFKGKKEQILYVDDNKDYVREFASAVAEKLPYDYFRTPDLYWWTQHNGVFLLNSILTVESGKALSHKNYGWQNLTMSTILYLYTTRTPIVWMLWGKEAQALFDSAIKGSFAVNENQLILKAAHPASEVYKEGSGFLGCKHFSKANEFLKLNKIATVNWETFKRDEAPF